ncbi:hypothetical protein [Sinorhizobium prairiense]|uniref:hypothetical protein n=1 Tax=unclassified Sinorhizobium TaxID=2613772 RepID=UPI0023D889BF|nr:MULTISPECIES: hypothetical protein [unclassified Sinorhizobium]WEJ08555.1 hypothetical protein N0Q90_02550 [Sinorhizobium sp. M103]WEJ13942.1 hypothetical protein N0Q91_00175 [Sinorhizobium sp. K101]WEJ35543.1 hypothetical protein N0R80_00165 [Sinorhizobium sp. C101]
MTFPRYFSIALVAAVQPVAAATMDELVTRYHVDPKNIPPEKAFVIDEHNDKPLLKQIDTDNDLVVSKTEFDAWATKKYGEVVKLAEEARSVGTPTSAEGIFRASTRKEQRLAGIPVEALLTEEKPKRISACEDRQQWFIRRDRLDNWMFDFVPVAKAQGASISYTSDQKAGENTLSIDGAIGVALWRDPCLSPRREQNPVHRISLLSLLFRGFQRMEHGRPATKSRAISGLESSSNRSWRTSRH